MLRRFHILLGFLCSLIISGLHAQTEPEIKAEADKLFEQDKFIEATSLYLRLLSLSPRDFNYNYRYGTCLLYNSHKKGDAIKYLKYAVTSNDINPEAYFYLGKAYHLTYDFNNAIWNYEEYIKKTGSKGEHVAEANTNIRMSQNGKTLMTNITDVVVVKKTEIAQPRFYDLYDLSNIGGIILLFTDFQSKEDKKRGHVPLVHFPQGASTVFFSSYGEGDNLDIYRIQKLPNGKWGEAQRLPGSVNTGADENYPYLHPSGKYLYFSSKGHNSMGGYDIFRSRFDEDNNSFLEPENIDFAVSSPDDDILYLVDKEDKRAFFASNRQSVDGKIHVYNVFVERIPMQIAILKGDFNSTINPENKKVSITVTNPLSDKQIGVFNSNTRGSYLITLPRGGNYEYLVKVDGSQQEHKFSIDVPFLKEMRPLKQEVIHEMRDGREIVRVINRFDENVEDAQAIIAAVIQERSELNVNIDEVDVSELEQRRKNKEIMASLGLGNYSPREIEELLRSKEAKILNEQENGTQNAVNNLSLTRLKEINQLDASIQSLMDEAKQSPSDQVKYQLLLQAEQKIKEREKLAQQLAILEGLTKELDASKLNEKDRQDLTYLVDKLEGEFQQASEDKIVAELVKNQALIKKLQDDELNPELKWANEIQEINKKIVRVESDQSVVEKDIDFVTAEISGLEEKKAAVKEKEKPAVQRDIDSKNQDLELLKQQRTRNDATLSTYIEQKNQLQTKLDLANEVNTTAQTPASTAELAVAKNMFKASKANENSKEILLEKERLLAANPEFANLNANLSETSKLTMAYNSTKKNVSASSSEIELLDALKANEKAQFTADKRLEEINTALANDKFNAALREEKTLAESFLNKLKEEEKRINQWLSGPVASELTAQSIRENLSPTLEEDLASANQKTGIDGLNQKKRIYSTYVKELENEIEATNKALKADPNDAFLQQKATLLQQELGTAHEELQIIAQEQQALENTKPLLTAEEITTYLEITADEVVPDFDEQISEISNSTEEPLVKIEQQLALENKLLNGLNPKINALEAKAQRSPTEEQQLNALKGMRTEHEMAVQALKSQQADIVASTQNTNPTNTEKTLTTQEIVAYTQATTQEIVPDFDEQITEISNSTEEPLVKIEQQLALENKLLNGLNPKINALEAKAQRSPTEEQQLNALKGMRTEHEMAVQALKSQQADIVASTQNTNPTNTEKTLTTQEIVAYTQATTQEIVPDFDEQIAEISNSTEEPLVKIEQQSALENKLLNGLNPKINALEAKAQRSPTEEQQLNALKGMRTEHEMAVQALKSQQADIVASTQNTNPTNTEKTLTTQEIVAFTQATTQEIVPDFDEQIAEISNSTEEPLVKIEQQLALENALISGLNPKINALEAKVQRSPKEEQQLNALKGMRTEHEMAVQALKSQQADIVASTQNTTKNEAEVLTELKEKIGLENADWIAELAQNDNELPIQQQQLTEYLAALNDPNLETNEAIENEKETVSKTLRKIGVRLGELEQFSPIDPTVKLENQLNNPALTSTERKKLTNELAELKTAQANAQLPELIENTSENQQQLDQLIVPGEDLYAETKLKEIQRQLEETDKIKNPIEKAFALDKLKEEQEQLIAQVEESNQNSTVQKIENENGVTLTDVQTDQAKLRKVRIEIGEVTQGIQELNTEKATVKKSAIKSIDQKITNEELRLENLLAEEEQLVARINKTNQPKAIITEEAKNQSLTFNEERAIASSEEYKEYSEAVNEATAIQQLIVKNKLAQQKLQEEILRNLENPNSSLVEELKSLQQEEKELYNQLNESATNIKQLEQGNAMDLLKMQNLIARGINPIKKVATAAAIIGMPQEGFSINTAETKVNAPVALEVNMPSGLVYRVQVGAFARPIPEELFSEFTPVSGEKINGTNITRYMAGYFNNSGKVVNAREQIRALGYSDAFVVAYCDGKRITFGEARNLEASGACVAKGSNELMIEVNQATAQALGIPEDTSKVLKQVSEYAYNQAPGAVEASPIEMNQGLFFTVQIGVFNRPVRAGEIGGIQEEVMTLRLPNGQIRYSTGVFNSPEDAQPRKSLAIERGIRDAYITAYYRGERISIGEARKILAEQGTSVLASSKPIQKAEKLTEETQETAKVQEPVIIYREPEKYLQLVTKKSFEKFPHDVLNRYNSKGSFYFDATDRKVKSVIYPSEDALPAYSYFKNDVELVELTAEEFSNQPKALVCIIPAINLPGDLADWMLRCTYRKELKIDEQGMNLRIFVPENSIKQVQRELEVFDLTPEIEVTNN